MKDIAVWGYGNYGRQMVSAVEKYWDDLRITGIYDRRAGELRDQDARLRDPDEIRGDYEKGLFEAVMIAVNLERQYREMRDALDAWGIPVFELGREEDYHPAADLVRTESRLRPIRQEGYALYVFPGLLGTVSYTPSNGIMYLFDEEGRALREHWDTYAVRDNFTHQYDFPVRFGSPLLQPIPLAGDWCVLARLWAFNYSHFLCESMDLVQLLEEAGFTGTYVISDRPYCREIMHLYGIGDERIRTVRDFKRGSVYRFERVYYPKLLKNDKHRSAPVLRRMAERMTAGWEREPDRYPARLYVKRSGTRKLLNGDTAVRRYGLTVIDPDTLPVREQMKYFYNADLILSPHGANSATSLFMREGTALVETFGRNWVKYSYINALRAKGVFYVPVVQGPIMPYIPVVSRDPNADYFMEKENLYGGMEIALRLLGETP